MSSITPNPEMVEALIALLRRDLKLGDDVVITPETQLFGGEHDLDSLDVLLLLTSIEKQFGLKVPNESIRQEAFSTPTTLATFIENLRTTASP